MVAAHLQKMTVGDTHADCSSGLDGHIAAGVHPIEAEPAAGCMSAEEMVAGRTGESLLALACRSLSPDRPCFGANFVASTPVSRRPPWCLSHPITRPRSLVE